MNTKQFNFDDPSDAKAYLESISYNCSRCVSRGACTQEWNGYHGEEPEESMVAYVCSQP